MTTINVVQNGEGESTIKKSKEITVTDELGRKISLKRPNMLMEFNFKLACGADASNNEAFMRDCVLLPWIHSIDGVEISPPQTLQEVKAIIQRLDYEGYSAAVKGFVELMENQKSEKEVIDLAKK